jgi:cytidine deaminase
MALSAYDLELYRQALATVEQAYAPYSHFRVGCALTSETEHTYRGVNIEIISFPIGVCAERNAIGAAITSLGPRMRIKAIAVAARDAGGAEAPCSPCGGCRQAIAEFGRDASVIYMDTTGQKVKRSINELLPDTFTFPS